MAAAGPVGAAVPGPAGAGAAAGRKRGAPGTPPAGSGGGAALVARGWPRGGRGEGRAEPSRAESPRAAEPRRNATCGPEPVPDRADRAERSRPRPAWHPGSGRASWPRRPWPPTFPPGIASTPAGPPRSPPARPRPTAVPGPPAGTGRSREHRDAPGRPRGQRGHGLQPPPRCHGNPGTGQAPARVTSGPGGGGRGAGSPKRGASSPGPARVGSGRTWGVGAAGAAGPRIPGRSFLGIQRGSALPERGPDLPAPHPRPVPRRGTARVCGSGRCGGVGLGAASRWIGVTTFSLRTHHRCSSAAAGLGLPRPHGGPGWVAGPGRSLASLGRGTSGAAVGHGHGGAFICGLGGSLGVGMC